MSTDLVLQLYYVCTMYTMIYTVAIYNIMYKTGTYYSIHGKHATSNDMAMMVGYKQ